MSGTTTCLRVKHNIGLPLKGTRSLGSVELVFEKRFVTVCYKMHRAYGWKDVVKVEYNDPHKYA